MEHHEALPNLNISDSIPVQDIMEVTARLTQLMAEEAEYFRTMDIKSIGALQEEKNQLVIWLEAQQKMLAIHPNPAALVDEEDRAELEDIMADFTTVAQDNFQQVSIARNVNKKVVEAVTRAIREQEVVNTYTPRGNNRTNDHVPISYKLNQRA